MELNEIAKQASEYAHSINAYHSIILKKKQLVHLKVREENEEFLISKPSHIFHKDSEQSEIADIILTLLSYCHEVGYDPYKLLIEKMEFNKTR